MADHPMPDPTSAPVAPVDNHPTASPAISRGDLRKKGAAMAAGLGLGLAATPALAARPVRPARARVTLRFAGVRTFAPNGQSPWPLLIAAFEKHNPNIKVEFIQMQSFNESTTNHEFLVTNLASGGGHLDVLTGDVIWVPEFYGAGWLLSPAPYMTKADLAGYYPGAVNAVSYLGQLAGIPWFVDGGMLYYRRDLLSKYHFRVPATYDELVHQAQVILRGERGAHPNLMGFLWQGKQAEVLVCDWVEFLGAFGGSVLNAKGQPTMDTPQARAALTFLHDLIYKDKITPQAVTTMDEEPSRIPFTQGYAVFLRNWSYVWGALLLLAGLQSIPAPHYEAAAVDRASRLTTFRLVTLPLLTPVLVIAVLIRFLGAFQIFTLIYVTTEGGPAGSTETMSTYTYKTMFSATQFGYGAAMAVVLFTTLLVATLATLVLFGRRLTQA